MILAVDGIDGSGKTTLLDNLEKLISDRMPGKRVLRLKALGSGPPPSMESFREGSDNQDRFDNIGDKMSLLNGFKEYHKNNLFRTSLMLNGNEPADVLAELVFKLL